MTNELIAEMQSMLAEAEAMVQCKYLQLAAAIMRECDCPGMAGDIDQVRCKVAWQAQDNRKVAGEPIPERQVRIDECSKLREKLLQQYGYSPKAGTVILLTKRIRELEADEE